MIIDHEIFDLVEIKNIQFDFTNDLLEDETLVEEEIALAESIESGIIPESPWTILNGDFELEGAIVTQSIADVQNETMYLIECTVETSEGRTLQQSKRIICKDE